VCHWSRLPETFTALMARWSSDARSVKHQMRLARPRQMSGFGVPARRSSGISNTTGASKPGLDWRRSPARWAKACAVAHTALGVHMAEVAASLRPGRIRRTRAGHHRGDHEPRLAVGVVDHGVPHHGVVRCSESCPLTVADDVRSDGSRVVHRVGATTAYTPRRMTKIIARDDATPSLILSLSNHIAVRTPGSADHSGGS